MKIKDILFQYIQDKNGLVDFNEISQTLLEKVPTSKWGISHWNR